MNEDILSEARMLELHCRNMAKYNNMNKYDALLLHDTSDVIIELIALASANKIEHGYWLNLVPLGGFPCSECGFESDAKYRCCPSCGAKMDLKDKGEMDEC